MLGDEKCIFSEGYFGQALSAVAVFELDLIFFLAVSAS